MKSTLFACFVLLFSTVVLNGQNSTTTKNTPAKTAKAAKKVPTKAASVNAKTDETTKSVGTTPAPPPPVNGTGGMPVMKFETKNYEFGKIKTGDKPKFTYKFKNTGNAPLDIDIVSGCDCTELDWTRTTVQPGESGYVSAIYNSNKAEHEDHKKQLKKYIDIVLKQTHPSNGYPLVESLTFNVFIID